MKFFIYFLGQYLYYVNFLSPSNINYFSGYISATFGGIAIPAKNKTQT